MRHIFAGLIATGVLTGCTSLGTPVTSLVQLSQLDPLESDPSNMRLAVRAPSVLKFRDGDVKLAMGFDGGSAETRFSDVFAADIDNGVIATPGIDRSSLDGQTFAVASLTPEAAARMMAMQKRIKALRAAGIQGKGSLTVSATACKTVDDLPKPLPITAWLQPSPDKNFLMLLRQMDLGQMLEEADHSPQQLPRCDESGF